MFETLWNIFPYSRRGQIFSDGMVSKSHQDVRFIYGQNITFMVFQRKRSGVALHTVCDEALNFRS
jgi:hypothetical protein